MALLAFAMIGCAGQPTDRVPTETEAIELAKKLCDYRDKGAGWRWRARFRHGVWHVWLNANYESDENSAAQSVDINASDGTSSGCPLVS